MTRATVDVTAPALTGAAFPEHLFRVPGDPAAVRAAADVFRSRGLRAGEILQQLRESTCLSWTGEDGDLYRDRLTDHTLTPTRAATTFTAVAEALQEASEACTRLRWHEGLRRRAPEAAGESRVRGARCSAEMDGARSDDAVVRSFVIGATPWPQNPDPTIAVVRGAVQATAEAEHVGRIVSTAPRQALARLHTAAAEPLLHGEERELLGRPRAGVVGGGAEVGVEMADLGDPPAEVTSRVQGVVDLLEQEPGVVGQHEPGLGQLLGEAPQPVRRRRRHAGRP